MDLGSRALIRLPLALGVALLGALLLTFSALVLARGGALRGFAVVGGSLIGSAVLAWVLVTLAGLVRAGMFWRAHPLWTHLATYAGILLVATALLATFGSLAILCLYLAEGAGTPARALVRAIGLFPRFLLAVIVTGLPAAPVELMLVILVLPCLYLLGRIALTAPVIVAERPIGVFAAIGRSVAMTRKRGFSMMAFAAVVMLTSMIAPMPFRLLHDAMQADATANPVAIAVVEGAGSLLAAIISLATLLLEVALYRRLAGSISGT